MEKFLAVDTETTGLKPRIHGIMSIGLALYEEGRRVKEAEYRIKVGPQYAIDPSALKVNGLDPTEGEELDYVRDVIEMDFGRNNLCVMHNAQFDCGFLEAAGFGFLFFEKARAVPRVICTQILARSFVATGRLKVPNIKLVTLCEHFNIRPEGKSHNALYDAVCAAELLLKLVEQK
jgi:DNA polymerase III epsilon subunit-like protein